MKLLDIKTMRERLGERDLSDINAMLGSALDIVTPYLAAALNNTDFVKQTGRVDYFYVNLATLSGMNHITSFFLSRGLLTTGDVIIKTAPSIEELASAVAITDTTHVNVVKGVVQVMVKPEYFYEYVSIEYTCGFETAVGASSEVYFSGVPEWLSGAAFQAAAEMYKRLCELQSQDTNKEWDKNDTFELSAMVRGMLVPYTRWSPLSYQPMML